MGNDTHRFQSKLTANGVVWNVNQSSGFRQSVMHWTVDICDAKYLSNYLFLYLKRRISMKNTNRIVYYRMIDKYVRKHKIIEFHWDENVLLIAIKSVLPTKCERIDCQIISKFVHINWSWIFFTLKTFCATRNRESSCRYVILFQKLKEIPNLPGQKHGTQYEI